MLVRRPLCSECKKRFGIKNSYVNGPYIFGLYVRTYGYDIIFYPGSQGTRAVTTSWLIVSVPAREDTRCFHQCLPPTPGLRISAMTPTCSSERADAGGGRKRPNPVAEATSSPIRSTSGPANSDATHSTAAAQPFKTVLPMLAFLGGDEA